jgi:hypothetical protein
LTQCQPPLPQKLRGAVEHLCNFSPNNILSLQSWYGEMERCGLAQNENSFVVCVDLMAKERGGICLDNFDWWSLTPDWSVIDEQVCRLAPPRIDGPSLIPDLWQRW